MQKYSTVKKRRTEETGKERERKKDEEEEEVINGLPVFCFSTLQVNFPTLITIQKKEITIIMIIIKRDSGN